MKILIIDDENTALLEGIEGCTIKKLYDKLPVEGQIIQCDYIYTESIDSAYNDVAYNLNIPVICKEKLNSQIPFCMLDNIGYLHLTKNRIINDSILDKVEYSLYNEDEQMRIRLAAVADKPNVNGITYTSDSFKKAFTSDRIKELFRTNALYVEYKLQSSDIKEFHIINMANSIGKVLAISDKYLYLDRVNQSFKYNHNTYDNNLLAYMRYIVKNYKKDDPNVEISNIITWDIYTSVLPKEYLESL